MNDSVDISRKPKLGIFDSGVGGFSVLKEVRQKTKADVLYFGDCARAPYGNRSNDEIALFIKEILHNLQKEEVTHYISACNSMSVMTTDILLKECGIDEDKYIDMLRAFKKYNTFSEKDHVLLIGTHATITSNEYQNILSEKRSKVSDYIFKTLAGLIEKEVSVYDLEEVVMSGLQYAKEVGATHILYGCTHYPLIDDVFRDCAKKIGWKGEFVDPSLYVGQAVTLWNLVGNKETFFETSEITPVFKELSSLYK